MEEIWRDFEGYKVSNKGHITKNNKPITRTITNNDYIKVYVNGKAKYLHRIVAKTFPDICGEWFDGCVVDHIDTNTLNACAYNLRVCNQSENMHNEITIEKLSNNSKNRPILQYDIEGNFIQKFKSVAEAAKILNVNDDSIRSCVRGKTKKSYGCQWKYEDDDKIITKYDCHRPRKKSVLQLDLNGDVIREFGNAVIASEETGFSVYVIHNCCKNRTKHTHGYKWKYKESA